MGSEHDTRDSDARDIPAGDRDRDPVGGPQALEAVSATEDGQEQPARSEPAELDPETRARRDATLRHVRKLGDPVLRARALEVERFDDALRAEVQRMGELMADAIGIGLAATQLGNLSRLLVYQAHPEDPVTALVNPVLDWASEEQESAEEGCLSIPGMHVEVDRSIEVQVHAQDPHGRPIQLRVSGLQARVIQHELDHLDGILIIDRISRERRKQAMRALREAQRAGGDEPDPARDPVSSDQEAGADPQRDPSLA